MNDDENAAKKRRTLRSTASASTSNIATGTTRPATTAVKRDSLAAELERDPQFSAARRRQRTQLFTNTVSHASLERQLLQAQTSRVDIETKLREKEVQIERLERDRRHFADKEKEEREAREREQEERAAEKKRTDAELKTLRAQFDNLQEEFADLQSVHSQRMLSSTQEVSQLRALNTSFTSQVDRLSADLESSQAIASSRLDIINSLQDQFDELQVAKDTWMQRTNEESDMGVVREELKKQAEYHRKLEGTNAKLTSEVTILRDRQTSVEVLREQNRSLELKLQYTESLRDKVAQLEAELEASRTEREQWASNQAQSSSSLPSTPSRNAAPTISQTQTLTQLRLLHASLLEEHGSTLASLRTLESTNASLSDHLSSSATQIKQLQETIRELGSTARKADTRVHLAEREVEFLQALVKSYESEEVQKEETTRDERDVGRIKELESLLSEYKSTLDSIATAPPSPSKPSREILDQLAQLRSELEECQKENTQHIETIDKLEQELFELSGEIAGGRHVPPGKRILQLADNPEQQWFDLRQATMDKLREENSALLKRLHDLESSLPSANATTATIDESSTNGDGGLVPRASYVLLQSSLATLEQTLAQKEKRLLRLQQVFTSKSAEFRDAITSILGVKLAFYPNGQVRLTSIFDLDASFVFQSTSSSGNGGIGVGGNNVKMQLVAQGEGGPQDLPSMMQYWIENEQCLPGFMASVTLECYEKAKMSGAGDPNTSV
ncbi:hypothetical protein AGABI2DRAFT_188863 [Agaricus bisporus var. bisporus H97]|uniref:hypothetical protein n=1 Tax=Agaricus bisporus var. bisporus (strain H97 / ATCC MYA-4626 / FGSC 10389) TaxID=936046 RepID=UPI00029F60A4|nr:hypothetical protein AGABI2DRAFT_188863 [Agaricus bisporus var. bisporus H97]EKV41945.1 hypothetical protein AGABI2DRAFT_188863 [Agaricus bisporus var. bisporus H97]